ncbi:hypothetical protein CB0940_06670 [Cercospora beticola]|uniref:BTB domain-containing protein n=1 Tax=Cercospora beticola TaxID=122368 RepID=A0A2G5HZK0_CERBT|nr:hypothetical protein CB0940_06670 [Cercospora beticola]PIA97672.1 hypothetical protein CB0940_06670 [Cercospora beticola]WPA99335.1 hypothetical protein RHO25_003952 [Cercospora beticola]CAK1360659.1 unnamed protein product [Cercospora beticola]
MSQRDVAVIAADGDLILVVGHEKGRIRVSSALLANASAVFRAIFNHEKFREFQREQKDRGGPIEIILDKDGYISMEQLCKMAHLKHADLTKTFDAEKLFDLAIHIDKYKCSSSLKLQSAALLYSWLDSSAVDEARISQDDRWRIVTASYLMDCPQAFKMTTQKLITETTGNLHSEYMNDLPVSVGVAIAEKRSSAWQYLCYELPKLGIPICKSNCRREARTQRYMLAINKAFGLLYWPPKFKEGSKPLSYWIEKTRGLRDIITACDKACRPERVKKSQFQDLAASVAKRCEGLCLECSKKEAPNLDKKCTVHTGH